MQLVRADIILISLSCIWSAISQDCRSNPDETCASTGPSVLQKNSGSGIALEDGLQRNAFEASEESASSAVCGVGEEVESTNCLGDSVVKEQAKATVRMMMGGCCTAWLVKSATTSQGALMLSTGHCGAQSSATFEFNYIGAGCGKGATTKKSCQGTRLSVEQKKDEQAIYELDKSCDAADNVTPIKLDIGRPDPDEGMYIIGHPNCRPQLLSHQEVHDDGHHCEVRSFSDWGGSQRVSYYCDTQGGNSGSPVFSARTGYAFAIHSHGGCNGNQMSKNWGGLLENTGIVAAFNQYSIPYVNRATTNIFKYEKFTEEPDCLDHTQMTTLTQKSLTECKKLCVGSLTCVGIEYSALTQTCLVNYRSSSTVGTCQGDSKYYRRPDTLTTSLKHSAGPTTTTTTFSHCRTCPPSVVDCGFESGLCGWTADAKKAWRTASSTPSSSTGPQRGGHNSSLKFAFVEASHGNNPDKTFILSGPSFGALPPAVTLEFWYHMYGGSMGKIILESYNGATWSNLWEMEGNKGDKWLQAIVSLPAGSIMLRFVAKTGSGWASDFALDDLSISTTQPPTPTTQPLTTQAPTTAPPTTQPPTPTTQPPTTQVPTTAPPATQPPTPTTQPPVTTTATTTVSDIIIPIVVNATETNRVDINVSIVK